MKYPSRSPRAATGRTVLATGFRRRLTLRLREFSLRQSRRETLRPIPKCARASVGGVPEDTVPVGDADISPVAALIGEPARAAVLMALLDGRALAASTLAAEAGVAASTLSSHLARLVDGGLVSVEVSGRHRYFRITRPEVADALEALAHLAPTKPIRSLRQGTHAEAIRRAGVLGRRIKIGVRCPYRSRASSLTRRRDRQCLVLP